MARHRRPTDPLAVLEEWALDLIVAAVIGASGGLLLWLATLWVMSLQSVAG